MSAQHAKLGDICEFKYGKSLPASLRQPGPASVYGSNGPVGTHKEALLDGPAIVVGRKGSYGEVHFSEGPLWPIDTTYYVDRSTTECDLRWLYYLLKFVPLTTLNRSAAIPGLNREDAYRLPVKVPPLPEQQRIAAILGKADALRRKRKRAIELLDSLTQSIFMEMFGHIECRPLSDVTGEIYRYPTYYGIQYEKNGIPEIRGELILEDGTIETNRSLLRFISKETSDQFPKTILESGDLVMSVRGTIGKIGLVPPALAGANMTANLVRIAPRRGVVEPVFLWFAMKSPHTVQALSAASASTTIATIKAADLRNLPVPHVSLEEQRRFVDVINQYSIININAKSHCSVAEKLFSALQHRAFSGQL